MSSAAARRVSGEPFLRLSVYPRENYNTVVAIVGRARTRVRELCTNDIRTGDRVQQSRNTSVRARFDGSSYQRRIVKKKVGKPLTAHEIYVVAPRDNNYHELATADYGSVVKTNGGRHTSSQRTHTQSTDEQADVLSFSLAEILCAQSSVVSENRRVTGSVDRATGTEKPN